MDHPAKQGQAERKQAKPGFDGQVEGLPYFVLDVFTDQRLTGNQLAVVMNPGWLSSEMMQAIARETNLSETTFIERRGPEIEQREGVLTRIFTTDEELPFAGHPTLGTASLLRSIAPETSVGDTVKLALAVGTVPVRFETQQTGSAGWPMRGEMTQKDPTFGELLDPSEVASLTGLDESDFDPAAPVQVVSTGTAFAIVTLRTAQALARLRVRQHEAGEYLRARGARWFYVLGPDDASDRNVRSESPGARWRARMQFHGGEDPATGSAAGCAISHLVHCGVVASRQQVLLRQGIEMNRPSEILLSATKIEEFLTSASRVTDVCVGGSTILVARGHLFLP